MVIHSKTNHQYSGPDFHVSLNACFSHQHLRSAGDSPAFYEPSLILPKEFVDAVGTQIESERKKPSKKSYVPRVPHSAIDACEHGHEAADGNNVKTANG